MVKKSLQWIYRSILWLMGISLIIGLIIAASIQFFLLPNIDQYKNTIAAYATKAAQQKVSIGGITAKWKGIHPQLSLLNVVFYDVQNRPALQLSNTQVTLSWLSIPMLEPHLAELTLNAPALIIRRNIMGEIFIAGIDINGASKPALPNWLLRQTKVAVTNANVVWLDEMRHAPALKLSQLNLEIISPPWKSLVKNHRIQFSALPSIGTKNPILINADVYGKDISRINEWHGNFTMQLKNTDIAAFKPWLDYPVDLQSGVGNAYAVVHFANHQVRSAVSQITLKNVLMGLQNASKQNVTFTHLSGTFNWENLKNSLISGNHSMTSGSTFNAKDLIITTTNGLAIKNAALNFKEWTTKDLSQHYATDLSIEDIELAAFNPFWKELPLPENVLQQINRLSPTGNLKNLQIRWEGNPSAIEKYRLNTAFNGLNIHADEKIPGFSNLSGTIEADQRVGKLTLNTLNAKLDFKKILRHPIPADKLTGEINWEFQKAAKVTDFTIAKLHISNAHLAGTLNGRYVMDGIKGGYLDLKGKFDRGNAKYAPFYYPQTLNAETLHWLDSSIIAGQIENTQLIIKGRMADFPFVDGNNKPDNKLGLFRVSAKLTGGILDYGKGWPKLEGLATGLLFEGKRMELNTIAGQVLGNTIIKSKAVIAELDAKDPILTLIGELSGQVSDGINFVNKSPVAKLTQGFTEGLKTSGSGKLDLNLSIPLNDVDRSKYKGTYLITNGTLQKDDLPTLNRVNGFFQFNENGFSAKNITAGVFNAPLIFTLSAEKDQIIRITAKGQLNEEALKQTLVTQNLRKAGDYLSGSANWQGEFLIQKPMVSIIIRSDLVGMTSRLPAPLNKSANEQLNLQLIIKQNATVDNMAVTLGNKLNAKISRTLVNDKFQFNGTSIYLKTEKSKAGLNNGTLAMGNSLDGLDPEANTFDDLAKLKGIQVLGSIEYLDADAWRNVVNDFTGLSKVGSTKAETTVSLQRIALNINALDLYNRRINQLKILNKADKEGLRVTVQSREISGDVQWLKQNNGKLIARLTHLIIPEASPKRAAISTLATNIGNNETIDSDQIYPALDITADSFEFKNKKVGSLALVAFPKDGNWNIQKLELINPESTLTAEGVWNNWLRNPNTRLSVNWKMEDLGNTFKRFGYADTIKGGAGDLKGQLNWAGSPHDFNILALDGQLEFEVRKGQILKVKPGVGRLLGLVSLQNLPRRLSLDFRDLFSNGFTFDKINATVKIDRGVMRSDNFTMSGPAADVTIKGETNLQKETQQLFVKVMPRISDSISLAALAGGPLVGAIAFLAQKILKDPLNKIASSRYEITGTWDNPIEVNANKNNQESSAESHLN